MNILPKWCDSYYGLGSLTSIQTLLSYAETAELKFTFPKLSWSLDPRNDFVSRNKVQGTNFVVHGVSILRGPSVILLAWTVVAVV